MLRSDRAVGGAVDHGHAPGTGVQQRGRLLRADHHLRGLRRAHSLHPAHHGGTIGLPARPASSLVSRARSHTHTLAHTQTCVFLFGCVLFMLHLYISYLLHAVRICLGRYVQTGLGAKLIAESHEVT